MPCGNLRTRIDSQISCISFQRQIKKWLFNNILCYTARCNDFFLLSSSVFYLFLLFVERILTKVGCNCVEIKSPSFVELMEQLSPAGRGRPPLLAVP